MPNPPPISVPLSIFGSLNLELSPPDLPEGASPANNDVAYLPGSVFTRPGLNRVFSVPVSALGPFSYEKSFVTPTGDIKNLYLTKGDGKLWVEDVTNTPGTATLLFQSAGATYASSCTALGREYITLSDGIHGVDIPISYDGTNVYRLTQDGPGQAPVVTSVAFPSVNMAVSGAPSTTSITSITTTDPVLIGNPPNQTTIYTTLTLVVTSTASFSINEPVSISGATGLNISGLVTAIISSTSLKIGWRNNSLDTETGGTLTGSPATTLVRSGNIVSCTTAAAHNLQVGFQAQIQKAGTTTVGGTISSLTIANKELPGQATIVTSAAHGLLPGNIVNILGVTGATVGTGITNIAFGGGVVTITTSAAHGLSVGSEILVAAVTNVAVNGQWTVSSVPSATTFCFLYASAQSPYTAADTGTVTYIWPLANVDPSLNYFTVQTAPSATSFTVGISYTDGTWSGGTVTFGWDGTFFVTAILSTTSFQYKQYGPNASTTQVGTVTPYGQMAPGIHQCRMSFKLADGTITAPSPPVSFVANGGQYPAISQAVQGPSNVVARIFQFTGAGGAYFFTLLVPAVVNGLTVSTSTTIEDNSTTSVLFDFSDVTLYAGTSVSVPGNDLASQIVLDPQSGMFTYASRLLTWGGRNIVRNFLNMGMSGGLPLGSSNPPSGWSQTGACGQVDVNANRLQLLYFTLSTSGQTVYQNAYQDAYGAPILSPGTTYSIRVWLQKVNIPSNATLTFVIHSASTSFSVTATITAAQMSSATQGGWVTVDFSGPTATTIAADTTFGFYGTNLSPGLIGIMDISLVYTEQPYIDAQAWVSYAENLTGFSQNTGILGAADDTSPIRNWGTIRNALYLVTGTGLHETEDNGQTEPSSWGVNEVADNCGAYSIAAVGRNPQGIGSAGKDWMTWNGPDGAQIFLGQKPYKISQEIQSLWDAVPAQYAFQSWVKNYESSKRCYFGMPDANGNMYVSVLDYRNIDSSMIPENPPIHISFTGKMIVSDLTRKWTTWTIPAWCGELLYRAGVSYPQIVFGCLTPTGGANAYILNPNQYHDDDFGIIPASYTTYFFVSHEQEEMLQVGSGFHLYTRAQAYLIGTGTWTLTPYAASLSNPQPSYGPWPLRNPQKYDPAFKINVTSTTRCAFRIQATPTSGQDAYFNLQKLVIWMSADPNAPEGGLV